MDLGWCTDRHNAFSAASDILRETRAKLARDLLSRLDLVAFGGDR
jgi:hypothetical protein